MSKSQFKLRAPQYFREVQSTGEEFVIADRGRPVLKLVRFPRVPGDALDDLRGSVRRFNRPLDPVGADDWEAERARLFDTPLPQAALPRRPC